MQYGFFFDQSRCSGCRACVVACKNINKLPAGPLKYLRIYEYEKGRFPDVRLYFHWIPCYHCEEPACIIACPNGAINKERKYGAVLINSEKCNGCRLCYDACPYGSLVFDSDANGTKPQKCDMCIDRLEQGLKPVCVLSCTNRALDFGSLEKIMRLYGRNKDLEDLPDSKITKPSVIFKSHNEKRRLIQYDSIIALKLFMMRDPMPPIYTSLTDVINYPDWLIKRNKLIIKHTTCKEFMYYTRDDEG